MNFTRRTVLAAAALAISIPALATGWAQSRIGPAMAATLAEKPELSTTAILLVAIPETMAILGFIVLLFGKAKLPPLAEKMVALEHTHNHVKLIAAAIDEDVLVLAGVDEVGRGPLVGAVVTAVGRRDRTVAVADVGPPTAVICGGFEALLKGLALIFIRSSV